jgi:NADH:quinone reductase (non-electrogenic)
MTTGKRPLVVDASEETTRRRQRPRVVIIGGGFAGLQAVRALRDADVDVLLLDRAPYTTFQPLLYQVATGGLNAGDITYALRAFARRYSNARFRRATVVPSIPTIIGFVSKTATRSNTTI